MIPRKLPLATFALAALMTMPALSFHSPVAHADPGVNVRVRGKVKVRVKPRRHRVRAYRHRHYVTPYRPWRLHRGGYLHWGGAVYIGPRYAAPPPPPPPQCDCPPAHGHDDYDDGAYYDDGYPQGPYQPQQGPSHRPPSAHHPAAAPSVPVVVAAPKRAPLPRLALGLFAGSIDIDEHISGGEFGLIGRVRLTRRLLVEGEASRSVMEDETEGGRLGAALLFDFAPRSRFSIQLLAGTGITGTETEYEDEELIRSYVEVGLGASYRLSRRLHLFADARGGALATADDVDKDVGSDLDEEGEPYGRGRVGLLVSF